MSEGWIRVYTGGGKGKTTSAIGEALNALLNGHCVCMVQFMKPSSGKGVERLMERFPDQLVVRPMGRKGFLMRHTGGDSVHRHPLDAVLAQNALMWARDAMKMERYHLMIMDEINMALFFHLIPVEAVLEFIELKPPQTNLVLTGRGIHPAVAERADEVVELEEIKHYYHVGVPARPGIEY